MARNDKAGKFDFKVFTGVLYVIDPLLPADHFFCGMDGIFRIGAGTDLQLRLFWLNLTERDRRFLRSMKIAVDS